MFKVRIELSSSEPGADYEVANYQDLYVDDKESAKEIFENACIIAFESRHARKPWTITSAVAKLKAARKHAS